MREQMDETPKGYAEHSMEKGLKNSIKKYRNTHGKKMIVWTFAMAAVIAAGIFFLGGGSGEKEKVHIIFIPKVIDEDNDFWKLLIEGTQMAAAENQVELPLEIDGIHQVKRPENYIFFESGRYRTFSASCFDYKL